MASSYSRTGRNTVHRIPKRAHYDRETVHAILDAAFIASVAFCQDGQPFIIPMLYGRQDEVIYLHTSTKSRFYREMAQGLPVCLSVTHLDGLVLARSAFHHSVNYRSAVVFGASREVTDGEEKMEAFRRFTEHILPQRWDEVRWPDEKESQVTGVLALTIEDASAKVRTGGPVDDAADYELPIWAGVVPMYTHYGMPIADDRLKDGLEVPQSVLNLLG